ncbi:O-methyltransferase-domain-containing protein [Xylariales sp. PMI_506]|nr:O-methyltransferase-domain-containing protein [Xylariales sp. PMI_506]
MAANGTGELVDISIAVRPNDIDAVPSILDRMADGVKKLNAESDTAREELLSDARLMVKALETPRETMVKHCWAQLTALAALVFGLESGLWILMTRNGVRPQKVNELAESLKVDPILLGRIMRHLGAMGYIIETGADEYRPTRHIMAMSIPMIGDGYLAVLKGFNTGIFQLSEWTNNNGWRDPSDADATPIMAILNTKLNVFEILQDRELVSEFNNHMHGRRQGRLPWMAPCLYPAQTHLMDGFDGDAYSPFLVDVGGGNGYDLAEFIRYYPNYPGKLILQDLPVVISRIQTLDARIVRNEYDFRAEQPVKGARAYSMHSILHNWPDATCEQILARVKDAMEPGYSKLLINEFVIPATGTHWEMSAQDIWMMALLSSRERTEAEWRTLLENTAGFKIKRIWPGSDKGSESLIECELPRPQSNNE